MPCGADFLSAPIVWTTCPYESRDGQFNPDVRQVNNVGDFQDFSEAVFYNAIAWALNTGEKADYEVNAGSYDFSIYFSQCAVSLREFLQSVSSVHGFSTMPRG